jgi:hypothetical protein
MQQTACELDPALCFELEDEFGVPQPVSDSSELSTLETRSDKEYH